MPPFVLFLLVVLLQVLPLLVFCFSSVQVPSSIASVDPTIAIPERFVEFADDYFRSLGRSDSDAGIGIDGRVKVYRLE